MLRNNLIYLLLFFNFLILIINKSKSQDFILKEAEFYKGDLGGIWEVWREKNIHLLPIWTKVSLPHTYNAIDVVDETPGYYQGPAWYRTYADVSINDNSRFFIKIFGGGPNLKVYIYDQLVGECESSYQEYEIEITKQIRWINASPSLKKKFNNKLPIAFRCDNSRDLNQIPSDLNDFPRYGGLFRKIVIQKKPYSFIKDVKVYPVYDTLSNLGKIRIKGYISSYNKKNNNYNIVFELLNDERIIKTKKKKLSNNEIQFCIDSIEDVKLWSPDNPNLYSLKLFLIEGKNIIDTFIINVGFKYFKFHKNGPFYLNGQRVLLKGVHLHEDHAGVGAAVTDSIHLKEIKLIKDMGANFIRLAHYQHSSIILNLCDKYGLLVWEEIPWSRGGLGGDKHKKNIINFLSRMIDQHHNHVSIIIWGLGNEIDLYGDFNFFYPDSIRQFLIYLNSYAKRKDSSRVTALRRFEIGKDITDIYSPSIWAGWYSGSYRNYEQILKKHYCEVDHFIHAEWGVGSLFNRFSTNPYIIKEDSLNNKDGQEKDISQLFNKGELRYSKDGDWSESYACDLVDWHLNVMNKLSWITGSLYWSFKDFATPLRKENPIPYVNLKGITQRDLTVKEIYYVFQSYWSSKKMIHIQGKNWKHRWVENNDSIEIKVYSNCDKVELIVNQVSYGFKNRDISKFPANGYVWKIPPYYGNYQIKAIGYGGKGNKIVDSLNFNLIKKDWGKPKDIKVNFQKKSDNLFFVEILILDENNKVCYDSNEFVTFDYIGDGEMIVNQGTQNGSKIIQVANGKASIYIKPKGNDNYIIISYPKIGKKIVKLENF